MNKGYIFKDLYKENFINDDLPLKEYPRPNLVRNNYRILNGKWDLVIKKEDSLPTIYDKKVMVPYALETPLSEVNYCAEPDDFIFYRRSFYSSKPSNKKTIIHFDGVDMICYVYINGALIGKHVGGYTKFSFDITDLLIEGLNELVLKVIDLTDSSFHSRGKQVLEPNFVFYTSSSGIYKPVWIEEVPIKYIKNIKFTPDCDNNSVIVKIETDDKGQALLQLDGKNYIIYTNIDNHIKIENPHFWSYDDPFLYFVRVIYEYDEIKSYFGYRKIEIKRDKDNLPKIYLNNKRVILNGLLDQGYYFLGNLTPKSYQDYENEIKNLKELEFNTIRKHIKTECDMFYYYCDLYGMLVIQDFINGGTPYKFLSIGLPRVFPKLLNKESKINLKNLGRSDENGHKEFELEAKEIVDSLYNHPSVIIYTIFNEGWGEFYPSKMYEIFKKYDPSRLYDTASGWYDSTSSDFYSVHAYTLPTLNRHDKNFNRPFILSETGGISLKVKENSYFKGWFGHGLALNSKSLTKQYKKLYGKLIKQIEKGTLNGIIYTQVADTEKEYNGLYTFDRKVLKIDKETVKEINKKIESL